MITYILETIAFQLVFLALYDLFLGKETFFQWNRTFLILAFPVSLVLPLVEIEVLSIALPTSFSDSVRHLFELEAVSVSPRNEVLEGPSFLIEALYLIGCIVMVVGFGWKLFKLWRMKVVGQKTVYGTYTKILVPDTKLAFSFFKNVFLGDQIEKGNEDRILAHELVHIKQWHTLDLLLFELLRILFWFNPLVYVYQRRLALVHEFIADTEVAREHRKLHCSMLLSEAFNVQSLSLVNPYGNKSVVKKRVKMLYKRPSKTTNRVKYVLVVPVLAGMLFYSSCELGQDSSPFINGNETSTELTTEIETSPVVAVPFALIEEVPLFPGCTGASDARDCFLRSMQGHIAEHFNYPKEAQSMGIAGRVNALFVVDVDGRVKGIRVRGPHSLLEDEVVRIIEMLPTMSPGTMGGKPVAMPFSIPITFKL